MPVAGAEQWLFGRASLGVDDAAVHGVDAQPLRGLVGRCALGGHVPEGVDGNRLPCFGIKIHNCKGLGDG